MDTRGSPSWHRRCGPPWTMSWGGRVDPLTLEPLLGRISHRSRQLLLTGPSLSAWPIPPIWSWAGYRVSGLGAGFQGPHLSFPTPFAENGDRLGSFCPFPPTQVDSKWSVTHPPPCSAHPACLLGGHLAPHHPLWVLLNQQTKGSRWCPVLPCSSHLAI